MIPRRRLEYRGSWFEEMDTAAIPCPKAGHLLVDELPHTNVPARSAPSDGRTCSCCWRRASRF